LRVDFLSLAYCFYNSTGTGLDWGGIIGTLAGLYFLALAYGAMGLFASSLAKNQVVALIVWCNV